jgi:thiol-disulfide isomerase/thioredoxin
MTEKRSPRRIIIIAAGLAVVAIAAVAALSTRGGTATPDVPLNETQPVTVTGTFLLPLNTGQGIDPAIGTPAPEISGLSFDGTPVSITNDGRPKIILFVAHWCSHCQGDVTALTSYIKSNGMPPDVEFYAVSTGTDASAPNYPPSTWLKDFPVPTIADSPQSEAAQAYGLTAFPFFVFVTAEGNVDFRFPGEVRPEVLYQAALTLANS